MDKQEPEMEINKKYRTLDEKTLEKEALGACVTGTTGSRSQDALRAGYDTTCTKGIAVLLGVDDITVEECSKFIPRAKEGAIDYINKRIKQNNDWEPILVGDQLHAKYSKYDWSRMNRLKRGIVKLKFRFNLPTRPFLGELRALEPEITMEGNLKTTIQEKNKAGEWKFFETLITNAKRGDVKYEQYDLYNKTYVPDECICEIKHALEIGMEKIQVAYPCVQNVPKNDPIIIGYIGEQMYFIAKYDEKAKVLLKGRDVLHPKPKIDLVANPFGTK
jgi:hypothetical protein